MNNLLLYRNAMALVTVEAQTREKDRKEILLRAPLTNFMLTVSIQNCVHINSMHV